MSIFGLLGNGLGNNFGPQELLFIIVFIIIFAIFLRNFRMAKLNGISGIILLVIGVIAVVASDSIYREGEYIAWFRDSIQGDQIMTLATALKYGGIASGAIGLLKMAVGFFKAPTNSVQQQQNKLTAAICPQCNQVLQNKSEYCPHCGTPLAD